MIKKLNFYRDIIISFSPGILSIFISLIALPIYLKILGNSYFGQYLIQNLFFTLGFLLNFGIYRLVIINNETEKLKSYLQNSFYLKINIFLSLFFSILIFFALYLIYLKFNFSSIELILNKYLFIGLVLSSIFFTVESILKINKKFYKLAFFNLSFNSLSFSIPAFYLYFKKNYNQDFVILEYPSELISITVFIKIISFLFFFTILLKENIFGNIFNFSNDIKIKKKDIEQIFYATSQSFIFFLNNLSDKFFVKIILGNSFLTLYSVPQQIAAKSTILITGVSSVFFPKISKIKTKERKEIYLKYVINITVLFLGFFSFCTYPFLSPLLKFWLGENYNVIFVSLIKIFLFYSLFASLNFLISQFIDSEKNIKNNTIIEISFFLLTFIFFIISMKLEKLTPFAVSICLREVLIFYFKSYYYNFSKFIKPEIKYINFISFFLIVGIIYTNLSFYLISIAIISVYFLFKFKLKNINKTLNKLSKNKL